MPVVEDLVKFYEFLGKLVDLLAACQAKVAISGALGRGSFDLIRQPHEGELEVRVITGSALI